MMHRSKVCMLYGFCEGPQIGKKFENALQTAGYQITHKPQKADIVIAHSAGCWMVPEMPTYTHIVLVGLPYPGEMSMTSAYLRNIWRGKVQAGDGSIRERLRLTALNLLYLWDLPHVMRIAHAMHTDSWRKLQNVILIRNQHDAICTPHMQRIPFVHIPQVIELPGYHDNCWLNPEPYIRLLSSALQPS